MYNNIYPNLHTITHTNILYNSNIHTITYSTLPYDTNIIPYYDTITCTIT